MTKIISTSAGVLSGLLDAFRKRPFRAGYDPSQDPFALFQQLLFQIDIHFVFPYGTASLMNFRTWIPDNGKRYGRFGPREAILRGSETIASHCMAFAAARKACWTSSNCSTKQLSMK